MSTNSNDGSTTRQTYAPACLDMLGVFTSCTSKIARFTDFPFKEQASCYCCRTSGRRVFWTDEIDIYASSCADWAITAEPDTAYVAAAGFETICASFSDVCATTTNDGTSRETDSSSSNREGIVTITHVIVEPHPTSESDSQSTGLSKGAIAGIAVGAVVSLLILCGVFLWCWRKKRASKNPTTTPNMQSAEMPGNSMQQQPMAQTPYGQQIPNHASQTQFNPVYSGNNEYQTASFSPPAPGHTQFVAELPAGK